LAEWHRRPENALWREFELAQPHILGALLDAAAQGLCMLPRVRLQRLPRIADLALRATACESVFRSAGTLETAYSNNRRDAIENIIDADPVATLVREIMADRAQWTGSASDLLQVGTNRSGWPKSPRALAGRLRRAQSLLRTLGIEIVFGRERRLGMRTIRITAIVSNRSHNTVSTVSHVSDNGHGANLNHPRPGVEQALISQTMLTVLTQNSRRSSGQEKEIAAAGTQTSCMVRFSGKRKKEVAPHPHLVPHLVKRLFKTLLPIGGFSVPEERYRIPLPVPAEVQYLRSFNLDDKPLRPKKVICFPFDLREGSWRETLVALIRDADVFVQGYRPRAIAAFGFGAQDLTRIGPGIVYVSLCAYGPEGALGKPARPLVQTASGFNSAEAKAFDGGEPKPLPAGRSIALAVT
jgi:CoA-transferase family III